MTRPASPIQLHSSAGSLLNFDDEGGGSEDSGDGDGSGDDDDGNHGDDNLASGFCRCEEMVRAEDIWFWDKSSVGDFLIATSLGTFSSTTTGIEGAKDSGAVFLEASNGSNGSEDIWFWGKSSTGDFLIATSLGNFSTPGDGIKGAKDFRAVFLEASNVLNGAPTSCTRERFRLCTAHS